MKFSIVFLAAAFAFAGAFAQENFDDLTMDDTMMIVDPSFPSATTSALPRNVSSGSNVPLMTRIARGAGSNQMDGSGSLGEASGSSSSEVVRAVVTDESLASSDSKDAFEFEESSESGSDEVGSEGSSDASMRSMGSAAVAVVTLAALYLF